MDINKIQELVSSNIEASSVEVNGSDGKYQVSVVSGAFEGLNAVKRQQAIYRILNPYISSGEIHAISMLLKTPAELSSS